MTQMMKEAVKTKTVIPKMAQTDKMEMDRAKMAVMTDKMVILVMEMDHLVLKMVKKETKVLILTLIPTISIEKRKSSDQASEPLMTTFQAP